jgi:hypothetical protein
VDRMKQRPRGKVRGTGRCAFSPGARGDGRRGRGKADGVAMVDEELGVGGREDDHDIDTRLPGSIPCSTR